MAHKHSSPTMKPDKGHAVQSHDTIGPDKESMTPAVNTTAEYAAPKKPSSLPHGLHSDSFNSTSRGEDPRSP